jgi:hypothetical protein
MLTFKQVQQRLSNRYGINAAEAAQMAKFDMQFVQKDRIDTIEKLDAMYDRFEKMGEEVSRTNG